MINQNYRRIYQYVVKKVDLSEFLETEIACTLRWSEPGVSASCICPFPDHREKIGSFRIKLMENGDWVFFCFGCNCTGTIVHFCQKYYGLKDRQEALSFICKKFGFDKIDQSELMSMDLIEKKLNVKKRIECSHIEVASQCRRLLRKDYKKYSKWVSSAYKRLNKALDSQDLATIEKMGFEACDKIGEK